MFHGICENGFLYESENVKFENDTWYIASKLDCGQLVWHEMIRVFTIENGKPVPYFGDISTYSRKVVARRING